MPILLAAIGGDEAAVALAASSATLWLAGILAAFRPPWARQVIGTAMLVVATAFAADALRMGTPGLFAGAAVTVALGAFLLVRDRAF